MKRLIILLLFIPVLGWAQEKKENNWGWRSYISTGMIAGDQGTSALFQLSGGVTYKGFFAGLGAGYDPYQIKSVPLFLDLKVDFLKMKAAFAYLNLGYAMPWDDDSEGTEMFKIKDHFSAGLYLDLGLGYRIPLRGAHNLTFSAGYGRKQMEWEKTYEYPCFGQPCGQQVQTYVYDYKFGRVIVKLAWEWGK